MPRSPGPTTRATRWSWSGRLTRQIRFQNPDEGIRRAATQTRNALERRKGEPASSSTTFRPDSPAASGEERQSLLHRRSKTRRASPRRSSSLPVAVRVRGMAARSGCSSSESTTGPCRKPSTPLQHRAKWVASAAPRGRCSIARRRRGPRAARDGNRTGADVAAWGGQVAITERHSSCESIVFLHVRHAVRADPDLYRDRLHGEVGSLRGLRRCRDEDNQRSDCGRPPARAGAVRERESRSGCPTERRAGHAVQLSRSLSGIWHGRPPSPVTSGARPTRKEGIPQHVAVERSPIMNM